MVICGYEFGLYRIAYLARTRIGSRELNKFTHKIQVCFYAYNMVTKNLYATNQFAPLRRITVEVILIITRHKRVDFIKYD
jgi:hypothetical protein